MAVRRENKFEQRWFSMGLDNDIKFIGNIKTKSSDWKIKRERSSIELITIEWSVKLHWIYIVW